MKCKRLINGDTTCNANAMKDSMFCYVHNPEIAEIRRENSLRGAKKRKPRKSTLERMAKFKIESDEDIPQVIVDIMNEYRLKIIDKDTAQTLGNLINVLVRAYANKNSKQIEEILAKLEEAENLNQYKQSA